MVVTTSSSSVSFSTSTSYITEVLPTTSNGVAGFTTVTSVVIVSNPATTVVDVGTFTTTPGVAPSVAAASSGGGGGSSGLSTGAKAGIGAGIGVLVLAVAVFGAWYGWYMRRRRRRNSLSHEPHQNYPNSPIPGMSEYGGSAAGGAATMGAMAAVAGYSSKRSNNTRSELASSQGLPVSPPPRSPDRLLPATAAIRSWGSASPPPRDSSGMSVSDQSDYSQGNTPYQHPDAQHPAAAGAGYFNDANELPDDQVQTQPGHHRTFSGGSATISPASARHSQPRMSSEQFYSGFQPTQEESYELPGQGAGVSAQQSGGAAYRGVEPEVPLHQRVDRVPLRPGHFPPSHNF